jgi:hypothetical protein
MITTWYKVTISNDLIPDFIKDIEIEVAENEDFHNRAEEVLRKPEYQNFSVVGFRKKRGGARKGAGAPEGLGKYGCKTKVVRVPEAIAPKVPEILFNIEQLKELINEWEKESANSTSPRYDRAKKLIEEIRALGF